MRKGDRVQTPTDGPGTVVDFKPALRRWRVMLDKPSVAGWPVRYYHEKELNPQGGNDSAIDSSGL